MGNRCTVDFSYSAAVIDNHFYPNHLPHPTMQQRALRSRNCAASYQIPPLEFSSPPPDTLLSSILTNIRITNNHSALNFPPLTAPTSTPSHARAASGSRTRTPDIRASPVTQPLSKTNNCVTSKKPFLTGKLRSHPCLYHPRSHF